MNSKIILKWNNINVTYRFARTMLLSGLYCTRTRDSTGFKPSIQPKYRNILLFWDIYLSYIYKTNNRPNCFYFQAEIKLTQEISKTHVRATAWLLPVHKLRDKIKVNINALLFRRFSPFSGSISAVQPFCSGEINLIFSGCMAKLLWSNWSDNSSFEIQRNKTCLKGPISKIRDQERETISQGYVISGTSVCT